MPVVLDPQSPVRVAGVARIEEADLVAAHASIPRLRSRQPLVSAAFFGVLAVGVPVYGLSTEGDAAAALGHLVIGVVFACLAGWVLHARQTRGRRAWAALEEWQRQLRFELTDSGFRVRTERSSNELEWRLYQSWLETPDLFCVELRDGSYHIVPKRAFDGPADVARVRELLLANVHPSTEAPKVPAGRARRTLLLWVILIVMCVGIYRLIHG